MKNNKIKTLYDLAFRSGTTIKLVSLITLYRIVTAPVLVVLILTGNLEVFKWMLLASFITDAIDGYISRLLNVNSPLGAKIDSIGDDLTVMAAIGGLIKFYPGFFSNHWVPIAILLSIFAIQLSYALIKYKRISSFHTYAAKTAGVAQAVFLLWVFLLDQVNIPLFYLAIVLTAIELIEEIILVWLIPKWKNDVKGLFWVLRKKSKV
ncbi:MAG TPA: CDP-alcohol phosphatidyltransferase family protein [Flavobacteriales bacterium]|nr:CDP-alcohol phosphatidyltransferase family protein [Flavobacteriales bacterium]